MTLGDSHKVTLIASSEEGALTMARAFAKLPVDKVRVFDHRRTLRVSPVIGMD